MLMSFLIETAIHDDREARRRRIFFVIHVLEVMISTRLDPWGHALAAARICCSE